jgi:hypothetical protein
MIIFVYTFALIFIALVLILGVGNLLSENAKETVEIAEGKATAQMCTTRLLEVGDTFDSVAEDDFVIEQDLVYTFDSFNL